MGKVKFIRLAETVNKKKSDRVAGITLTLKISNCIGSIWFTDIMLQEGKVLTGYSPKTETFLKKSANGEVWFNGVIRSENTIILPNLGSTSAGLDVKIMPKTTLAKGTLALAQGAGGQKVKFPNQIKKGDELALLSSKRKCTKNGAAEPKEGFYQYTAAWDSKHVVSIPNGKCVQALFSFTETDGGDKF